MAYLLQVVVLTRYAQTLLRVGRTGSLTRCVAQKYILKLIHTRIGKHQCGVALHYHRSRGYDCVTLALEEIQKCLSNFV